MRQMLWQFHVIKSFEIQPVRKKSEAHTGLILDWNTS